MTMIFDISVPALL